MTEKWMPRVDVSRCTACRACIVACDQRCLEITEEAARLVRPDDCGSDARCVLSCPERAIRMAWVPLNGNHRQGLWRSNPLRRRHYA